MKRRTRRKNQLTKWIALLAALLVLFTTFLVLLLTIEDENGEVSPKLTLSETLVKQRTLVLNSGDTVTLPISDFENVAFAVSDAAVVSVDSTGKVTALKKGNAIITATCGDETATIGVIVDGEGTMIDVSKLTPKVLFSDMLLNAQTAIQGMAVDPVNNAIYFSQGYGHDNYLPLTSDIMITKVMLKAGENGGKVWMRDSWMRLSGSGKGYISLDAVGGGTKLWVESNGSQMGYGTTVSLLDWQDYGFGQDEYGQTFQLEGAGTNYVPTSDSENDLIMVYDRSSKAYLLYDRSDLLDGKQATYLARIDCASNQLPQSGADDSQGRYNASIRGFALANGYIYQFSGKNSIYVSVFDLEGNLQYCHRITEYPDMENRLPAAISCVDGKVYVTVASGSTSCYLANVWVFE